MKEKVKMAEAGTDIPKQNYSGKRWTGRRRLVNIVSHEKQTISEGIKFQYVS